MHSFVKPYIKKYNQSSKKYVCENCDYNTGILYNYNKHLLSLKHKNATNADTLDINGTGKVSSNLSYCCSCCKFCICICIFLYIYDYIKIYRLFH